MAINTINYIFESVSINMRFYDPEKDYIACGVVCRDKVVHTAPAPSHTGGLQTQNKEHWQIN